MNKIKKIMAAGLWSKKSDLRPWAVEHPMMSIVLAIGFNTGMYVLSAKLADIVIQAIEDNTEKFPVVEIQQRIEDDECTQMCCARSLDGDVCGADAKEGYYCDEHQWMVF